MAVKEPKVVYLNQRMRHRIEKLVEKNEQLLTTVKSPSMRLQIVRNLGKLDGLTKFVETPHGRRWAIREGHQK